MNIPKDLQKYNLVSPEVPKRRRLIALVWGKTSTGKSDLALRTMPRPLLHIDLDRNLEPLESRHVGDDVLIKRVHLPRRVDQDKDNEVYTELRELYETATKKDLFASVCIDGADGLYDLVRRAKLGTVDFGDAPRSAFSLVNSNMKWWVNQAKDCRVNLLMTSRTKEHFKNVMGKNGRMTGVGTGEHVRAGWGDLEFEVPLVCRSSKKGEEEGADRYRLTVIKCTPRPDFEDEELVGESITWANLGYMSYYPHTKRSDWAAPEIQS